jgi:hypothetical protein
MRLAIKVMVQISLQQLSRKGQMSQESLPNFATQGLKNWIR